MRENFISSTNFISTGLRRKIQRFLAHKARDIHKNPEYFNCLNPSSEIHIYLSIINYLFVCHASMKSLNFTLCLIYQHKNATSQKKKLSKYDDGRNETNQFE